ncbi:hypothetical protein GQ43DRAFT_445013 [Delitschia confertaspora ATCC 74209]|uniref:MAPEG family protein n=1 Tax=Delitschia confertaspora ATCC 74209 TaxID=1513339 RepID=A0A9P4JEU2_9PLEO|nr:hypothetical protein GQ43DRAFT_445013 [Delitschia confertaspora ATCC 74209]
MPSYLDPYNPSILAIPAYYVLSLLPHMYAVHTATAGHPTKFDNRNPRSSTLKSSLKGTLDAETYAKYERAESAHANGMENLPLFATAVILGNMAGFKKDGIGGLTGFAGAVLAVRAAYTVVYIGNKTQGLSVLRSSLWAVGTGLCLRVIVKAAKALGSRKFGYGVL